MKKQHNTCSLVKIKELQRLFSEFKISLFIFLLTAFNLSAARAALPGDSGFPDIHINRGSIAERSQDPSPQRQVRGQIKDASNGEAMPGVNIRIEGTSLGTASDVNGGFTIEVPGPDAVLIFSFVGYNQQSITVGNQDMINVELVPDVSILNEVVVVGYNSQQRLDISGSISVVDVSKATVGPSQQIGKQLQGRAAGVTIFTTGQPRCCSNHPYKGGKYFWR